VFVGTLVSNERDQPPFISAGDDDPERLAALARGDALLAEGRAGKAAGLAREWVARDGTDAGAHYLLGRALLAEGAADDARAAFQRARDEDQLRFRAPGRLNEVLRSAAAAHGATVVEVEAALRTRARDGVIGHDLITEHLHPNVEGYFLLAAAYHDALLAAGLPGPAARAVPADVAREEVPLSAVDRLFGEYKVMKLMGHWPFTDTPTEPVLPPPADIEAQLAQALFRQETDWIRVHRELKAHYRGAGPAAEYLRVSLILADAFPFVAAAQLDAGRALMAADRHIQAVRYLHAATRYAPDRIEPLLALARACIASGLGQAALDALARAERIRPGDPAVARLRAEAQAAVRN
jgi:Flp pilus assembly protein TadD